MVESDMMGDVGMLSRVEMEVQRSAFADTFEQTLVGFMNDAADMARAVAQRYFRQGVVVDEKEDRTPVTVADREIEQVVREMVVRRFPHHGFYGEEFGGVADLAEKEFVWVLDPVDGTRSFITGRPLFAMVFGLLYKGQPLLGLIDQPITKERWVGRQGRWARFNGRAVRVSPARTLAASRLYTGSVGMFDDGNVDVFLALARSAKVVQYCCDGYAYGLLATGCVDAVVEQDLKIYDIAGVAPIVTGAGGVLVDWHLNPVFSADWNGQVIAASSFALAEEYAQLIRLKKAG